MDIARDHRTLHAVLSEIGWADPNVGAAALYVVELAPAAPPVRDVIVALDDASRVLVVWVRFLPQWSRLRLASLTEVLSRTNEGLNAGVFGLDDDDGSLFFRHTLELGSRALAADAVRHAVLVALETISDHIIEIAQAATGRSAGFAD